jgi:hypothetical protein
MNHSLLCLSVLFMLGGYYLHNLIGTSPAIVLRLDVFLKISFLLLPYYSLFFMIGRNERHGPIQVVGIDGVNISVITA